VRQFAPEGESGVADYARELAAHLKLSTRYPLYHIGNNQLHAAIYRQAIAEPGIVLLHDAVLHHLMLGMLSEAEYLTEFAYNFGDWSLPLAQRLWRQRSASGADAAYFRYPMLRRLAERSIGVLVHNRRAAAMVKAAAPGAYIAVTPHLALPDEPPLCDLGPGPVFGLFGYLRPTKRVSSVIAAAEIAGVRLVIAGDPPPPPGPFVHLPLASEPVFRSRLRSCDAIVNLRYPSAGETSGITIRAMAIGRPVILTAGGEAEDFPPGTYTAVDSGPAEVRMLAAMMIWLAQRPADRAALGLAAQTHVLAHHSPEQAVAAIQRFAESVPGVH
jgi:glycosyltransferase involved in cell wall biosynthesis